MSSIWDTINTEKQKAKVHIQKELSDEIKEMRASKRVFSSTNDTEHYIVICFSTNQDKKTFLFTSEEKTRQQKDEKLELKVLHLATDNAFQTIVNKISAIPARWTETQLADLKYLLFDYCYTYRVILELNVAAIVFKENLINVLKIYFEKNIPITNLKSATDVLRLAVALSDGDVTFKTETKFRKFKRSDRRILLSYLENTSNLLEDVARYPERWKRFLHSLHPSDYKFEKVKVAYDALYNNNLETFNSKVEAMLLNEDLEVLELLKTRPGDFMRRLRAVYKTLNPTIVTHAFVSVLQKLSIIQLLKIEGYLKTINDRKFKTIAPKGNWSKLQIIENKSKFEGEADNHRLWLLDEIAKTIHAKLSQKYQAVQLAEEAKFVKLQTSDSELTPYGRGTVFMIPDNIKFIRTASYWQADGSTYTWFDNGWNFFDADWKSIGTCCWNVNRMGDAAIFSGDPTNSKEMQGRACQMIDLYLDKLPKHNVRYAVWNILCYSNIPFDQVKEVYAALQWGEDAQKGKLFEPSRCQLSFQLKGSSKTKYIAYIDLQERKLVYLDANLRGNIQSASNNEKVLQETMPAMVEYLQSLPSVHDLFNKLEQSNKGVKVAYSDKDITLSEKEEAYVFKTENEENSFTQIDVAKLLNL